MDFSWIRKAALVATCVFICLGFRSYPGTKGWLVHMTTAANRKVFVTIPTSGKTLTNNLPASDALGSAGAELTQAQLITSVLADYNAVNKSLLMLVADSDTDFAAYSNEHRIILEEGAASGLSSGEAKPTFNGAYITACQISLTEQGYKDAKTYLGLVTHEIGHCVGLEHPQETVNSVMSYFHAADVYRLAIDDKMGLVHLYPKDPADAQEKATLGLSCARQ